MEPVIVITKKSFAQTLNKIAFMDTITTKKSEFTYLLLQKNVSFFSTFRLGSKYITF